VLVPIKSPQRLSLPYAASHVWILTSPCYTPQSLRHVHAPALSSLGRLGKGPRPRPCRATYHDNCMSNVPVPIRGARAPPACPCSHDKKRPACDPPEERLLSRQPSRLATRPSSARGEIVAREGWHCPFCVRCPISPAHAEVISAAASKRGCHGGRRTQKAICRSAKVGCTASPDSTLRQTVGPGSRPVNVNVTRDSTSARHEGRYAARASPFEREIHSLFNYR
jgi:hypothetical protein